MPKKTKRQPLSEGELYKCGGCDTPGDDWYWKNAYGAPLAIPLCPSCYETSMCCRSRELWVDYKQLCPPKKQITRGIHVLTMRPERSMDIVPFSKKNKMYD